MSIRDRATGFQTNAANGLAAGIGGFLRWSGLLGLLASSATHLFGQVLVSGTVADRDGIPVAGAAVVLQLQGIPDSRVRAESDESGGFAFRLQQVGRYFLDVAHAEFFPIRGRPIDLVAGPNVVSIDLIDSGAAGTTVDVYAVEQLATEQTAQAQTLEQEQIDAIPMSRSTKQRIQGITAILPGVLRDPLGGLHFNGSPEEETNWMLDGFSVSDPASGRLEMALGAESVSSLDLFSGRYSAALGKGTGGAMVLTTRTGDDRFRQRFTNFVPGIDIQEGLRFRDWRPRHTLSGPILSNRAWFFNSLDVLYEENFLPELPDGEDRSRSWSVNNSLRLHARLTPRQTLSSSFVADYLSVLNSGLSPLDPIETTLDRKSQRYFFSIKDQILLSPESVLDLGYAAYRSTYRGVPQGGAPYRITFRGREGNYPIATHLVSGRDEFRSNLFVPVRWLGQHQLSAGGNLSRTRYLQDVRRSVIGYLRVDGTLSRELSFAGTGAFEDSNIEAGAYLQDRWAVHPRLVAELGLRWDRDRIVSGQALAPRLNLAFMPPRSEGTRLSAGLGWIPAATYLRVFTRHRDQDTVFTRFAPDGATPVGPPDIRRFQLDGRSLAIPTTRNLSAGWSQRLPGETDLAVNYLRKRMRNGYAHFPTAVHDVYDGRSPVEGRALYFQLQNSRREHYDSVEFSLSKQLRGSHRWFASYTYSRTWSNAAVQVENDNHILFAETAGRLSWDVPHRLVSWASFPLGEKTSLACFAEWRDGFPFSVHDDNGILVGEVNGWRLPRHFSLNVHIERKLSFLGHRWSLRPGVDNLTNRPNYRVANNNISSPEFLHLHGRSPIKLVIRVRWLGTAGP